MNAAIDRAVRPVAIERVASHRHGPECLGGGACPLAGALRALLAGLGEPLRTLARPGGRTVIKPNLVADRDREHRLDDAELAATCTDPVLLALTVREAWDAMERRGEILIVDSPIEGTDIGGTLARLRVPEALELLRDEGIAVAFRDLRDFTFLRHFWIDDRRFWGRSWNVGWLERREIAGDPEGYCVFDLGEASYFEDGFAGMDRLRFHQSDPAALTPYHAPGRHLYSVARSVLAADCVINLPKLKTHKKSGVSLALKSLIGISNRKHWIPHYRHGHPPRGDEFDRPLGLGQKLALRLKRFPLPGGHSGVLNVIRLGRARPIEGGSWKGNDVVWRASRDLNVILLYGRADGTLQATPVRGYLTIVDGVVGGEGDGPLRPTPKPSDVLIGGEEPLSVDVVACRLMGIPPGVIAMVDRAVRPPYRLGENEVERIPVVPEGSRSLRIPFALPKGWG